MAKRFFGKIAEQARTNVKESKNLGSRNRSLDTIRQDGYNEFNKHYKSQSGDDPGSPSRANYQTYPYDYFTGTTAKIFFGDVWVDDIISINYNVSQSKEPIYGYASQTFDAVARGVVIVQGSFSIAFKEMGYLNIIQNLLEQQRNKASAAVNYKLDEIKEKAKNGKARFEPRLARDQFTGRFGFSPTGSAQIIRQEDTIEDILMYKKDGNIIASGLGGKLFNDPKADRDFEDFAELMEDTIWGDSNGNPLNRNYQFRRADEFDYRYDGQGNDIGGIITSKTKNGNDYSRVLNILMSFGDQTDFRAEHTLVALNDVHIISESMIVAPTGEPIAVTYSFFAKDINQTIYNDSTINVNPIKFELGIDYELSTLDDVKNIEDALLQQEVGSIYDISTLSRFNEDTGWEQFSSDVGLLDGQVVTNPWEPVVDQVISIVERGINQELGPLSIDTSYSQYVIQVKILNGKGLEVSNPLTMVINQRIPATHTYTVISPTRQNFRAPQIFTRDDLWKDISKPKINTDDLPVQKPDGKVDSLLGTITQNINGELVTENILADDLQVEQISRAANLIATARADESNLTGARREEFIRTEINKINETNNLNNIQPIIDSTSISQADNAINEPIDQSAKQVNVSSEITAQEAVNQGLSPEEIAQTDRSIELLREAINPESSNLDKAKAMAELTGNSVPKVAFRALTDEKLREIRKLADDPETAQALDGILQEAQRLNSGEEVDLSNLENILRLANTNEKTRQLIQQTAGDDLAYMLVGPYSQPLLQEIDQIRQRPFEVGRQRTIEAEGFKQKAYPDAGGVSIGIGFHLSDKTAVNTVQEALGLGRVDAQLLVDNWKSGKSEISEAEANQIFDRQYEIAKQEAEKLVPNIRDRSPQLQTALYDLVFNTGVPVASEFENALAAAKIGDEETFKYELINSQREEQTKGRGSSFYSNELTEIFGIFNLFSQ